jgi:hypothetical protein
MLICPRVVCGSTTCHLAHLVVRFFQAGSELESEDTGALLVSPFNVEWGCYAWAWCVESVLHIFKILSHKLFSWASLELLSS